MKRAFARALVTASAAAAVIVGVSGAASAASLSAGQGSAVAAVQPKTSAAAPGAILLTASRSGSGSAQSIAIPANAHLRVQAGFACISDPINACGYVFSAATTETLYRTVIAAGIGAAAQQCSNFLNGAGFGYLAWVCNAVATWLHGQLDPRGTCLFVGAAGTTPIAVYTRQFCA